MSFPWPVTDDELVLDEVLDIVMRYFDLPPDEEQYAAVESFAAEAIMAEWRSGGEVSGTRSFSPTRLSRKSRSIIRSGKS
jgi:hypothetical protein